jgi:hypothetical protein
VKYLNRLNAEWVAAARRISPPLLIDLLDHTGRPAAQVRMTQDTAWRLFSKGLDPDEARQRVTIEGDQALAAGVLGALAVLA